MYIYLLAECLSNAKGGLMPKREELIDSSGGAKFITMLGLAYISPLCNAHCIGKVKEKRGK